MTYGMIVHVAAPVEMYDQMHAELQRTTQAPVEGLLLHIGRPTDTGFDVIEVWESKALCDYYNAELVGPALARFTDGQPPPELPAPEEFEVRGLLIPSAGIAQ